MNEKYRRRLPRDNRTEVDPIELVKALWKEKWIILGVASLVTCAALVYSLLLPPVFETNARTLPPRAADVAPLNLGRAQAGLPELDPSGLYAIFMRNLTAETTRRTFFIQHYRPFFVDLDPAAGRDMLMRHMREDVAVSRPDERNNPQITEVTVRAPDPEIAAAWNSLFLETATAAALNDLKSSVVLELENKKAVLRRRIEILREFAATQREDRIVRLQDALNVAKAVGLDAPQVTAGKTAAEDELSQMIDGNLAYLRGSKAIQAELELLKARKNEDPYIPELRTLQQQLDLLNLVNAAPKGTALFTLDKAAEVPNGPVEPRKKLIVAFGVVLGGLLGALIALVRIALRTRAESGERPNAMPEI